MDEFDPYYKWLSIPPKDQPPHHYRLLGIEVFESDAEVIEAAAERHVAYLQSVATGPHGAASQRLLNEIAAARRCLLNDETRTAYDAELRKRLPADAPPPASPPAGAPSAAVRAPKLPRRMAEPRGAKPARGRKLQVQNILWLVAAALGLTLLVVLAIASLLSSHAERAGRPPARRTVEPPGAESRRSRGAQPVPAPRPSPPPARPASPTPAPGPSLELPTRTFVTPTAPSPTPKSSAQRPSTTKKSGSKGGGGPKPGSSKSKKR